MPAITELKNSLATVKQLIHLESKYADPPDPVDRDAAYGLRGAATVLTLACFEAFLSSLFEEELERVNTSHLPLKNYNERFRVEAVFATLDLAMKGDHSTRGIERSTRIPDVMSAARAISTDSFVPRALALTHSNPDSNCVRRMFRAAGRTGIFEDPSAFEKLWGTPVAGTYCADTLDALVASRNRVAHTAEAAHVTRTDLGQNVRFIETLALVLANDLRAHVSRLIVEATAATAALPT
jgi:RiboL-PSP-HEPN